MALGLNSLMSMGNSALFASQAGIQTTGNNISNVNTVGYSRQYVALEDMPSLDYYPGQIGQGVQATQILRQFDRFVENAYLDKATLHRRYEQEHSMLRTVETAFNEANSKGIADSLTKFFQSWSTLAEKPENLATRQDLISKTQNLSSILNNTDQWLNAMEEQIDGLIKQDVDKANQIIQEIASLTRDIKAHTIVNRNNVNSLLDKRDLKVRELSAIMDIKVQDHGSGEFMVTTGSGELLVQDDIPFSLSLEGPRTDDNLTTGSPYDGSVEFMGKDGYEYTVEVLSGGTIDKTGSTTPAANTATYRVSIDGGRTWLKDDAGNDKVFFATDEKHRASVKDLEVYFNGSTPLQTGDKFVLIPKKDVHWNSPTRGKVDISTQVFPDGLENGQRITGGSLAALLEMRDQRIGVYRDQLNSFTDSLTWEVNRLHTQGAGLEPMTYALGDSKVINTDVPLASHSSGLYWKDRLQAGNMTFAIYDTVTGKPAIPYPGLDLFSDTSFNPALSGNFDPNVHSLDDVANAFNTGPLSTYMEAKIIDNRLQLTAKAGYSYSVATDTSGLAAALGINNFLKGESPSSIAVTDEIIGNPNLINAGRVNGAAEGNIGDNKTANDIADLFTKDVPFFSSSKAPASMTLTEFYGSIVGKIGADTASVGFLSSTEGTMAKELAARRDEISGVSLDEEMSNLIKFQSSYKAAAKLITTADQMFQTILGLKQ